MDDAHYYSLPGDADPEEHAASTTASLPTSSESPVAMHGRRLTSGVATIVASVIFLISLMAIILNQDHHPNKQTAIILVEQPQSSSSSSSSSLASSTLPSWVGRGVREGVSEKSAPRWSYYGDQTISTDYNWTDAQLNWQRTAFHFQSHKNWINDPDGPLFYMGWYHLFYQYNPDSAIWGNITWGHAVSKDLIHWLYLPLAMVPDQWFDWNGVWTGSATLLPNGQIIMLYTGDTDNYVQVQNLAHPKNLSDPLLLEWDKYPNNPVMVPPPGIAPKDFRDPSTAWKGPDGTWRLMIGSKVNGTGIAFVYQTTNFTSYELLTVAHAVEGTGMWECVDFYPVSTNGSNGLDTSTNGPGIKHVLKASLDNTKHDVYALGTYDPVNDTWTPDNPELDVGIGLHVDFGKYYASKTFYDQNKERRILWGWIGETDSDDDDLEKGWSGLQSIPRVVTFDNETGTNILQWPVEEIESLRLNSSEFLNVEVGAGSVVPIDIGSAIQLDISAEFAIEKEVVDGVAEADLNYNCSGGAVNRGVLGPFGLLTIADESLSELTPIYFYLAKDTDGTLKTWFCADELRSSKSTSVYKRLYGGVVPVIDGENYSMRVLVDHSVVESFAQGGRGVISSRVYPTEAIYGAAKLFAFNNATDINVTVSLKIWQLDSAHIRPYPFDDDQLISSL